MAAVRGAVYRVPFTLDSCQRLCLSQPRRQGRKRVNGAGVDMSRVPPQRRGAARETAVPLTPRRQCAGVHKAQVTARQGGAAGTAAASQPLTLRQGWTPAARRFTGGPGHDGEAGMVRSMTARPDARGAGEGIPVQHHRWKSIGRTTQSFIFTPERSVKRYSRTPAGGASARPLAAGPWPAEGVFAREQAAAE